MSIARPAWWQAALLSSLWSLAEDIAVSYLSDWLRRLDDWRVVVCAQCSACRRDELSRGSYCVRVATRPPEAS
eukprot:6274589-Prorocentrum_lima.AAC.1